MCRLPAGKDGPRWAIRGVATRLSWPSESVPAQGYNSRQGQAPGPRPHRGRRPKQAAVRSLRWGQGGLHLCGGGAAFGMGASGVDEVAVFGRDRGQSAGDGRAGV